MYSIEQRLLHCEGDTPVATARKTTCFRLILCLIFARGFRVAVTAASGDPMCGFTLGYNCFVFAFAALTLAWLLLRKAAGDRFLAVLVGGALVVVSWYDLLSMVQGERGWGYFVLITDVLLIAKAPVTFRKATLGYILFWLLVTGLELQTRFGLLDLPYMTPYSERVEYCEQPPCAADDAVVSQVVPAAVVIFLDFFATARFADATDAEKRKMAAAVDASHILARRLADFDLQGGAEYLHEHADTLPPELCASFHALLANLESYRPFLPDALFENNGFRKSPPARGPPDDAHAVDDESFGTLTCSDSDVVSSVGTPQRTPTHGGAPRRLSFSAQVLAAPVAPMPSFKKPALETRRMSLLVLALEEARSIDDAHTHGDSVAVVIDTVKLYRGSVDRLGGDRVHASFNAFRSALNHAVSAVDTAVKLEAALPRQALGAAVVTGQAYVGCLGTAAMRSPAVVGGLSTQLEGVLRGAVAVGARVACCTQAAEENVQHPLRLLLHEFAMPEAKGRWRTLLHALDRSAVEHNMSSTMMMDEWMYEIAAGDAAWRDYNTAAAIFHSRGTAAGMAHLKAVDAPARVQRRFRADAASATLVDLRTQVTQLPMGDGGTPTGNHDALLDVDSKAICHI